MKKLFIPFVLFALISTVTVQAQDYKPFRVGLGLGYASPAGGGDAKGGILLYLEPSYRVTDAIAVGLKAELAVMARVTSFAQSGNNSAASGKVSAAGSYTLNGQYYFMTDGFRPYAGLGFGIYSLASVSVSSTTTGGSTSSASSEGSAGTKFGFYPRIGFDAGHFTLNIEYNIIPSTTETYQVTNGTGGVTTAQGETKNNYLGIRLGFFIGGGKK